MWLLPFYPLWLTTLDSRGLFTTFYPLRLATFDTSRLFTAFHPLRLTTFDTSRLFTTLHALWLATLYARRLFPSLHALWLTALDTLRLFPTLYPLWLATLDTVIFRIAAIIHDPGISLRRPPLDSILTNVAIVAETVIEAIVGTTDIVVAAGISGFNAIELTRREAAVIVLANLWTIYRNLIAAKLCAAWST
jgi:hypothetical protein